MQNTGESELLYRPPLEANSMLLPTTVGCSWAKCTFCHEIHEPFRVLPPERLEEEVMRLSADPENRQRDAVFLVGSNAFVLSADRLCRVFDLARRSMPWVARFNMYARATDVLQKTPEELRRLKEQGLHTLYIGVESGSDRVLLAARKGVTSAQLLEAFGLLDQAGVAYGLSSILGLGGQDDCMEHIMETAALYNRCHPASIRVMTLSVLPDTPLYQEVLEGRFRPLAPGDILMEERVLLSQLTVEDCLFVGTHVTNNVPVAGLLPRHKQAMLTILDTAIRSMDLEQLREKEFEHM